MTLNQNKGVLLIGYFHFFLDLYTLGVCIKVSKFYNDKPIACLVFDTCCSRTYMAILVIILPHDYQ
jgi:hypothetical protein